MLKKTNKKLLLGFIAPYLVTVIIVFVIQYISNTVVMNALKNNVVDIVHNSFDSNIGIIDQDLQKIKETAAIVSQNLNLQDFDKNDFEHIYNAREALSSYSLSSGAVKDICVQNDKDDYLINFSVGYKERIKFYETMVYSDNKSPEELLAASEIAYGFSSENICYYNAGEKVIPFVYPTPILKTRTGAVFVYADEKKLFSPFREIIDKSRGYLVVVDENGTVTWDEGEKTADIELENLSEDKSRRTVDGEEYYFFSGKGNSAGWKYVLCLPENYVLSSMKKYQFFSFFFNFLILLLGFATCLFFSIRKVKSYKSLADALGIKTESVTINSLVSNDEYHGIKVHVSKMKQENVMLLEKNVQNILKKLLHGKFEKIDEITEELSRSNVSFDNENCGVVCLKYSTEPTAIDIKNLNNLLLNKIESVIPNSKICFDDEYVAIIFECEDVLFKSLATDIIMCINDEILDKHSTIGNVGASLFVAELSELPQAYNAAREVVDYNALMEDNKVLFYDELPTDDEFAFSIDVENKLFKSVLESDFESARSVLRQIYDENFVNRKLCVTAINELLSEIKTSLKKISRMKTEYIEFSYKIGSVKHFFENAISFAYAICSENESEDEKVSRGQKICKEIKNYIELHYNNVNLSLDSIAEEFYVHPNYLSTLFKKNTGINLITFLENVRIEKAKELLACGKYTVNEVALSVGYEKDDTFRRRFKKITGVPPSSFIKN